MYLKKELPDNIRYYGNNEGKKGLSNEKMHHSACCVHSLLEERNRYLFMSITAVRNANDDVGGIFSEYRFQSDTVTEQFSFSPQGCIILCSL